MFQKHSLCQTFAMKQLVSRFVRPLQQHSLCPGLPVPCNNTQLAFRFVRPLQQHTACVQACQTLATTQVVSRLAKPLQQYTACVQACHVPDSCLLMVLYISKNPVRKGKVSLKPTRFTISTVREDVLVLNYRRKATTKWA